MSTFTEQIECLTHEKLVGGLHRVKNAQVSIAKTLFDEDVPAPEIQHLLTEIENGIYEQILTSLSSTQAGRSIVTAPLAPMVDLNALV